MQKESHDRRTNLWGKTDQIFSNCFLLLFLSLYALVHSRAKIAQLVDYNDSDTIHTHARTYARTDTVKIFALYSRPDYLTLL